VRHRVSRGEKVKEGGLSPINRVRKLITPGSPEEVTCRDVMKTAFVWGKSMSKNAFIVPPLGFKKNRGEPFSLSEKGFKSSYSIWDYGIPRGQQFETSRASGKKEVLPRSCFILRKLINGLNPGRSRLTAIKYLLSPGNAK